MPKASDFRKMAREALAGKWWLAILIAFVAMLLGGLVSAGGAGYTYQMDSYHYGWPNPLVSLFSLYGLFMLIFGGMIQLGHCQVNIKLQRRESVAVGDLFCRKNIFGKAFGLRMFKILFIWLWSLIGVGPAIIVIAASVGSSIFYLDYYYLTAGMATGMVFASLLVLGGSVFGIIAGFRYAMASYLMSENPSLGIREAVNISKKMMKGHKGRLFCLRISFIGWTAILIAAVAILSFLGAILPFLSVLVVLGMLLGGLVITTYMLSAEAAFFLNLNYYYQQAYGPITSAQPQPQAQPVPAAPAPVASSPVPTPQPVFEQAAPQEIVPLSVAAETAAEEVVPEAVLEEAQPQEAEPQEAEPQQPDGEKA